MAEAREVSAWINACKMTGQNYFFVEGMFDLCFWKKFIDRTKICIQFVKGWEKVLECVDAFNKNGLGHNCLGVIDSDFEKIYQYKQVGDSNVFMTDYHDTEMMMYHSDAIVSAIQSIDRRDKIKEKPCDILKQVLPVTDRIGYLKLTSLKNNLQLIFKKENDENGFDLPRYEKLLDKGFKYIGDKELIIRIFQFTNNYFKQCQRIKNPNEIQVYLDAECSNKYDSYQLSNGHDVTYVLHYFLKKKYALIGSTNTIEGIETTLLSAYNFDHFKKTDLYKSVFEWSESNNKSIFIDK